MVDPRLIEYVKKGLDSGLSISHIEDSLIREGWRREDVDEAIDVIVEQREKEHIMTEQRTPGAYKTKVPELIGEEEHKVHTTRIPATGPPREALPGPIPPESEPEKPPEPAGGISAMGVFTKFKMILVHPGRFFEAVKTEKGYEAPVKYYLFLLFIQIIIANAVLYLSLTLGSAFFDPSMINPLMGIFAITTVSNFLFANIALALSIVILFVMAWFFNIFLRLFKGKGRMVDTFKGIVYAYTPNVILTIITIPLFLLMFYSLIPSISPVNFTTLDLTMAELSMTLVLSIISIIFMIWTLYLELKGLSIFHEISMLKVFIALVIGGIVLWVILSFVLGFIFALILFGGMFAIP